MEYKFNSYVEKARHLQKEEAGGICVHCGASIPRGCEICPECGTRLVDYCTFCGADMPLGAKECPECGMSVNGIECPNCGARSYRAFCPNCNQPLTRVAMKAVEKAMNDPLVQQVQMLIQESETLQEEIEKEKVPDVESSPIQEKEKLVQAPESSAPAKKEKLKQLETDINKLLAQMLPQAGSTPQQQRNFYSARKIAIKTKKQITVKEKVGWVCNLCGCQHQFPSECAMPELGGRWIYHTHSETVDTVTYTTIKD